MKIVLASNNRGKLAELQAMFAPLGCTLVAQSDLGVPEAPEPYRTFVENALAKARNAAAAHRPAGDRGRRGHLHRRVRRPAGGGHGLLRHASSATPRATTTTSSRCWSR